MATLTKPAGKPAKPAKKVKRTAKTAKRAAKVGKAVTHGPSPERHLARKLAGSALKKIAARALESGATALRSAIERAGDQSFTFNLRDLPVQRSIDVAVPIRVAWDQWMQFELIPEGIARIVDVERDGDQLVGKIRGAKGSEWVAEIVDEREQQSFAWRSYQGSDCAGLITFHELGERLTRIELDLDIQPTSITQGVTFNTHVADRRAEVDLRRLKARLEFINPDIYESEEFSRRRSGSPRQRRKHKPESKGDA